MYFYFLIKIFLVILFIESYFCDKSSKKVILEIFFYNIQTIYYPI